LGGPTGPLESTIDESQQNELTFPPINPIPSNYPPTKPATLPNPPSTPSPQKNYYPLPAISNPHPLIPSSLIANLLSRTFPIFLPLKTVFLPSEKNTVSGIDKEHIRNQGYNWRQTRQHIFTYRYCKVYGGLRKHAGKRPPGKGGGGPRWKNQWFTGSRSGCQHLECPRHRCYRPWTIHYPHRGNRGKGREGRWWHHTHRKP